MGAAAEATPVVVVVVVIVAVVIAVAVVVVVVTLFFALSPLLIARSCHLRPTLLYHLPSSPLSSLSSLTTPMLI